MADISRIVDMVAPRVPDAPDPVIQDEVIGALEFFCRKSKVWQQKLGPLNTIPGFSFFSLADAGGGDSFVFDIESINVDGVPIEFGDEHTAAIKGYLGGTPRRPKMYYRVPGDDLTLYPTPDKRYAVTGIGYMAPSPDAETFPDFIFNRWARGLMHGTIANLCAMRRKPWSDPEMASDSMVYFQDAINEAMRYANGNDHDKQRVTSYGGL